MEDKLDHSEKTSKLRGFASKEKHTTQNISKRQSSQKSVKSSKENEMSTNSNEAGMIDIATTSEVTESKEDTEFPSLTQEMQDLEKTV